MATGPYRIKLQHLDRLLTGALNGLKVATGLEHQGRHHRILLHLVQEQIAAQIEGRATFTLTKKEILDLESALLGITEVMIRLNTPSPSATATLLRQMRTMISFGYARTSLSEKFHRLSEIVEGGFFKGNEKGADWVKAMDKKRLRFEMKKDEDQFIFSFKNLCERIKEKVPLAEMALTEGEKYLEGYVKMMPLVDVLDTDELNQLDREIRSFLVQKEASFSKSELELYSQILGERHGVFGQVRTLFVKGQKYGMKKISLDEELMKDEFTEMCNEITLWANFDSPYLHRCYGWAIPNPGEMFILREIMWVSVEEYLHGAMYKGKLMEDHISTIARDMALGLAQLHEFTIIHRNLKPSNIYVAKRTTPDGKSEVFAKIGDFGLGLYKYDLQSKGPSLYTPPEVLRASFLNYGGHGWSSAGDMYSYALCVWEMGASGGRTPFFPQRYQLREYVGQQGLRPGLTAKDGAWPEHMKEVMQNCWQQNPWERKIAFEVAEDLAPHAAVRVMADESSLKNVMIGVAQAPRSDRRSITLQPTVEEMMGKASKPKRVQSVRLTSSIAAGVPPPGASEKKSDKAARPPPSPEVEETDRWAGEEEEYNPPKKSFESILAKHKNVNKRIAGWTDILSAERVQIDIFFWQLFEKSLTDKDCEVLADCLKVKNKWKRLSVSGCKVTNVGLEAIGKALETNRYLLQLSLCANRITNVRKFFKSLSRNPILETLELQQNRLNDVDAAVIGDYLEEDPLLLALDISDNEITNAGLKEVGRGVAKATSLIYLCVKGNQETRKGRKYISKKVKEHNKKYNAQRSKPLLLNKWIGE